VDNYPGAGVTFLITLPSKEGNEERHNG